MQTPTVVGGRVSEQEDDPLSQRLSSLEEFSLRGESSTSTGLSLSASSFAVPPSK